MCKIGRSVVLLPTSRVGRKAPENVGLRPGTAFVPGTSVRGSAEAWEWSLRVFGGAVLGGWCGELVWVELSGGDEVGDVGEAEVVGADVVA
jgi:hypothetical protein